LHEAGPCRIDVEPDTPGANQSTAKAAATDLGGQIQKISPEPTAERGGGKETDVPRQSPHVPGMIGKTLELERDPPKNLGLGRDLDDGKGLEDLTVGGGVTDGGVAGNGLHDGQGAFVRTARQR